MFLNYTPMFNDYDQLKFILIGFFILSISIEKSFAQAVYRVNSGGQEVTTPRGTFSADKHFSTGSSVFSTSNAIAGTTDDNIYKGERNGKGSFSYSFPLSNGTYKVILHFAEIYFTASGKRVFDVSLENKKVLDNYDIFRKVGSYTATTESFDVGITDGTLNVNFSSLSADGGVNNPKVSAIEVLINQTTTTPTAPSTTAPAVTSYTLVNASNEQDILTITNGANLILATLPSKSLNIRANTSNSGSVKFSLSGMQSKAGTESSLPFTLFGDASGNYNSWTPATGSYTLTTTPYSASGATGTAGIPYQVSFTVTNSVVDEVEENEPVPTSPSGSATIVGTLKKWQPVTLNFTGPSASQTGNSPNPFLDYKLQVVFTHTTTGKTINVPGFFDGDGVGGASGNRWRVRFSPDEAGTWNYNVSFRKGANIAIDLSATAGTVDNFNGTKGSFNIAASDATAPGFLKKGRLNYTNEFYLKFQDNSYWIKGGLNSPENFLGLAYSNHVQDWRTGDPDWNNGQGKGIIGALNYLGNNNVNSIYFMPMNIGGDAQDTHPFAGTINKAGSTSNDNLHYDIKKLSYWEKIFDHAQRKGIMLHFVLSEAEEANKKELDNATLGRERKLFYRELIARFGHYNALQWNLSEEYDYKHPVSPDMIKTWAQYLQDMDPYNHPITVHNYNNPSQAWTPFIGDSRFSVTSFQYSGSVAGYGSEVQTWRTKSASANHPTPISLDEPRSTTTSNMINQRKELLWHTYFSGGAGIEYYVGGQDANLQDFRPFENIWKWTWNARKFMQDNLPFWQMQSADGLLTNESSVYGGGQVFAKTGQVYAIYLPNASNGGTLNLGGTSGSFQLRWYNPRTGLFEGSSRTVTAGGNVGLGSAPSATSEDWVVLLKNTTTSNTQRISSTEAVLSNLEKQADSFQRLQITPTPNPTSNYFTLITRSLDNNLLELKVVDVSGRLIERKTGVPSNGTIRFGENFKPGIYYVEVVQGLQKVTVKLIKQVN